MTQRQVFFIVTIIVLTFTASDSYAQIVVTPGGFMRPSMGMPRRRQKPQDEGFTIQYNYKLVKYKDTTARCRRTTWESLDALIRNDKAYKEGIIIQTLENDLDSCKTNTENKTYNYRALNDVELQLRKLRKEDKSFHTLDYEKEVAFYKAVSEKAAVANNERKAENVYIDSIISSKNDTSLGAILSTAPAKADPEIQQWELTAQMDAIAAHHCLSVFTDMDCNFAHPRLSRYLASMGLSRLHDSVYLPKTGQPVLKYNYFTVSSSGVAENKLNITYYLQNIDNKYVIQSCEISGDSTILKNLFIKYWPLNTYPGARNTEAIANKYLFNDFISLAPDKDALKIMICPRGRQ